MRSKTDVDAQAEYYAKKKELPCCIRISLGLADVGREAEVDKRSSLLEWLKHSTQYK